MFHSVQKPHPFWFYICGFNIAILAGLFAALFSRLRGRWRGALTALACIKVYTLLAERGNAPANSPEWIKELSLEVVLLSVAAGDREGRPSPDMLDAVESYTLLRTDRNGWIELSTDGAQL